MTEGQITSLLIIALCAAALHSIVDLRRKQAKQAGVPYFDGPRRLVLGVAAVIALLYLAAFVLALAAG